MKSHVFSPGWLAAVAIGVGAISGCESEVAEYHLSNPAWYAGPLSPSVYVSREYAPKAERLAALTAHLRKFPEYVEQMREDWTAQRGGRAAWKEFHEEFLSLGSAPLPVLRDAMMGPDDPGPLL